MVMSENMLIFVANYNNGKIIQAYNWKPLT